MIDSYIIRIYRHLSHDPQELVGTIQSTGCNEPQSFSGVDHLWEILKQELGERETPVDGQITSSEADH